MRYRAWSRITSGVLLSVLGAVQYGTSRIFYKIVPHFDALGACPRINVYRSLIPRQLYGVGVEMDIAVVSTSTAVSTSRFIGGMTPYKGILVEHMAPDMWGYTGPGTHA